MRVWIGGPRVLGVRTGLSFGREDFRRARIPPPASSGTFVYVVDGDPHGVKVGKSSNPNARLATLQTGSTHPLRLSFVGATSGIGYDIEAAAHALLAAHRVKGEWFRCSPELAASALMGAAAKLGHKLEAVDPRAIAEFVQAGIPGPTPRAWRLLFTLVQILSIGVAWSMAAVAQVSIWPALFGAEVAAFIFYGLMRAVHHR